VEPPAFYRLEELTLTETGKNCRMLDCEKVPPSAARFAPLHGEFSSTAPHDQDPPGFYRLQDPLLLCHPSPKRLPIPVVAVLKSRSLRFDSPDNSIRPRTMPGVSDKNLQEVLRKSQKNLRDADEQPT